MGIPQRQRQTPEVPGHILDLVAAAHLPVRQYTGPGKAEGSQHLEEMFGTRILHMVLAARHIDLEGAVVVVVVVAVNKFQEMEVGIDLDLEEDIELVAGAEEP